MVLVSVGDNECTELFSVLLKVAHIGNDHVYPGHFLIGERKSTVDNDDIPVVFKHGHVFSDLAETAERNYLQLGCR